MKKSLPFPEPQDPLISLAKRVLAKKGAAIAELVGRPVSNVNEVSFRIDAEGPGIAHAAGAQITLFKKYCDKNPQDVEGVVVHELAHAIQRGAAYHGDFVWMVEGLADFVRFKLGYGTIQTGDPSKSYKVAAGFFNWMYERPDNKKAYTAFIKDLNECKRPENLEALLAEYNNGSPKADVAPPQRRNSSPPTPPKI